jgi:hypothetical protein
MNVRTGRRRPGAHPHLRARALPAGGVASSCRARAPPPQHSYAACRHPPPPHRTAPQGGQVWAGRPPQGEGGRLARVLMQCPLGPCSGRFSGDHGPTWGPWGPASQGTHGPPAGNSHRLRQQHCALPACSSRTAPARQNMRPLFLDVPAARQRQARAAAAGLGCRWAPAPTLAPAPLCV